MWDDLQHSIIPPSTRRRQGVDVRFEALRGARRPGEAKKTYWHDRKAATRDKSTVHLSRVIKRILKNPTPFGLERLRRLTVSPESPEKVRALAADAILHLGGIHGDGESEIRGGTASDAAG